MAPREADKDTGSDVTRPEVTDVQGVKLYWAGMHAIEYNTMELSLIYTRAKPGNLLVYNT